MSMLVKIVYNCALWCSVHQMYIGVAFWGCFSVGGGVTATELLLTYHRNLSEYLVGGMETV